MFAIVNLENAKYILENAIIDVRHGWRPSSSQAEDIKKVILGDHKTYRYILTTALLSKATNGNCNPLALQAGSELTGAYDARSVCHKVLVPTEREQLSNLLGASNEPFLNKPARFKELSLENAVRKGNDFELLSSTIRILEKLEDHEQAYHCLKDCIFFIFQRPSQCFTNQESLENFELTQAFLVNFAQKLLTKSIEGETSALVIGIAYKILSRDRATPLDVKVHKVNQSGSSSKEISDIDVFEGKNLIFTIEVKDKAFSTFDVEHAVHKVIKSGKNSLIFATGPRGKLQEGSSKYLQEFWKSKGFSLFFVNVFDHFASTIFLTSSLTSDELTRITYETAFQAGMKDATLRHIKECLQGKTL